MKIKTVLSFVLIFLACTSVNAERESGGGDGVAAEFVSIGRAFASYLERGGNRQLAHIDAGQFRSVVEQTDIRTQDHVFQMVGGVKVERDAVNYPKEKVVEAGRVRWLKDYQNDHDRKTRIAIHEYLQLMGLDRGYEISGNLPRDVLTSCRHRPSNMSTTVAKNILREQFKVANDKADGEFRREYSGDIHTLTCRPMDGVDLGSDLWVRTRGKKMSVSLSRDEFRTIPVLREHEFEECDGAITLEELQLKPRIKTRNSERSNPRVFYALMTSEDVCDGGNSLGALFSSDLKTVIGVINDSAVTCLDADEVVPVDLSRYRSWIGTADFFSLGFAENLFHHALSSVPEGEGLMGTWALTGVAIKSRFALASLFSYGYWTPVTGEICETRASKGYCAVYRSDGLNHRWLTLRATPLDRNEESANLFGQITSVVPKNQITVDDEAMINSPPFFVRRHAEHIQMVIHMPQVWTIRSLLERLETYLTGSMDVIEKVCRFAGTQMVCRSNYAGNTRNTLWEIYERDRT